FASMSATAQSLHQKSTYNASTYPLSLHDALPILLRAALADVVELHYVPAADLAQAASLGDEPFPDLRVEAVVLREDLHHHLILEDRKSTRLNSSHVSLSYAVFCL